MGFFEAQQRFDFVDISVAGGTMEARVAIVVAYEIVFAVLPIDEHVNDVVRCWPVGRIELEAILDDLDDSTRVAPQIRQIKCLKDVKEPN